MDERLSMEFDGVRAVMASIEALFSDAVRAARRNALRHTLIVVGVVVALQLAVMAATRA